MSTGWRARDATPSTPHPYPRGRGVLSAMAWSRETRQSRGYTEAYLKARRLALQRDDYLCQCPRCQGGLLRVREAQQVDHIRPLADYRSGKASGDPNDLDNLRSVSAECHERITLAARGAKPAARYDRNGRRVPDE